MNTIKTNNKDKYHCCFCRHFQLEGARWGYCDLLNVRIKGNVDACQLAIAPFTQASTTKAK